MVEKAQINVLEEARHVHDLLQKALIQGVEKFDCTELTRLNREFEVALRQQDEVRLTDLICALDCFMQARGEEAKTELFKILDSKGHL